MQRHFPNSEALCEYVAALSPRILLAFSCGKDAIAAWLFLRRYWPADKIQPYYLYTVPGLQFVEHSLRYYEDFFGASIARAPHPAFFRLLNNLVFQSPERCHLIEQARLPSPDYDDIVAALKRDLRLPADAYTANGTRATDSLLRRIAVKKHGSLNPTSRKFMPVFDHTNERLSAAFREAGVKLPVDYALFGRSFDGICASYLVPLARAFPDDFRRILDFFPLAELETLRPAFAARHAQP